MDKPPDISANNPTHAASVARVLEQLVSHPHGLAEAEARGSGLKFTDLIDCQSGAGVGRYCAWRDSFTMC